MQVFPGPRWAALACVIAAGAASALISRAAEAQPARLGAYTGTVKLQGTEVSPKVTYSVTAKVTLPVSQRDKSSVTAEFLAGEAPNSSVTISQWDQSFTEKSADSGGQFNTWSCSLAAPVEVPMTTTGVLTVNLKTQKHAMSVTLLSTKEVAFNCTHSRSGPYKKKMGIALTFGTGAPGAQSETELPFTDASHLAARYTLMPTAETKKQYGPIVQEWDLQLAR